MDSKLFEEIDRIYHPRAVAAIGVSDRMESQGKSFLLGHQQLGFKGPLYGIHPTKKLARFETYPALTAVPGPVDYVKICVPAERVPGVMKDCAAKGVRCATIFSSGFRESGTARGLELEQEMIRIARQGGVRVIGPNCMGLYCPETGLSIRSDMPDLPDGRISLVSQSGGVTISLAYMAAEKGIGFSKAVSYGNESDLGPPEFLPYLARDPQTSVICLYIEGTRRPEQLRAALADAAAKKPLIILKGGMTEVGERAVASHTGALTGAAQVWRALARQTGAIMADDLDDLVDLAMLYTLSRPPAGRRIGILTISGGFGVFATDQVINAGFEMPELSAEGRAALLKFVDAPGTSVKNPVDMAAKFFQPQNYERIFSGLNQEPAVDSYIVILAMEYLTYINEKAPEWSGFLTKALINALNRITDKPVYVVFFHTILDKLRQDLELEFIRAGYPVYPDMERCLTALARAADRDGRQS